MQVSLNNVRFGCFYHHTLHVPFRHCFAFLSASLGVKVRKALLELALGVFSFVMILKILSVCAGLKAGQADFAFERKVLLLPRLEIARALLFLVLLGVFLALGSGFGSI